MSQHHPMPPPPPPPPSSSRPQLPGIGLDEQLLGHDSVHTKNVNGIGWNVTGEKLASGSDDKTARIYDVSGTGQVKSLLKLDGHTDGVLALCWDPASPHRVVTSAGEKDKMVRVWDIRTGKPAMVQKMGQEYLNLAWSPDGSYIGVGSATLGSNDDATKDSMSIIDLRKGKARLHRFPYQLEEFCFSPNSKMILMTTEKGTIEIYRFEAETISSASPASEKSVPSSSSSSTTISAASSDERGWRGVLRSIKAHSGNIYSLAMHYNAGGGGHGGGSGMLAVGSKDSLVSLWDLEHLVCQRTVAQHETSIRSLSFSPDGERIASASYDHTVDVSRTAPSQTKPSCSSLCCLILSHEHIPDCKTLALFFCSRGMILKRFQVFLLELGVGALTWVALFQRYHGTQPWAATCLPWRATPRPTKKFPTVTSIQIDQTTCAF